MKDYVNTKPWSTSKSDEGKRIRKAYRDEEYRLNQEFRRDLFEDYGVTDNPKAQRCFEIAWEYGHSSGYSEVAGYFATLVDLIRPDGRTAAPCQKEK